MEIVVLLMPVALLINEIYNANVEIIEDGYALVHITGSGSSSSLYVSIDGTEYYSASTVVVPVGTVIYCYAISEDGMNSSYYGIIYLNSTKVATATNPTTRDRYYAEYNYTTNGDIKISLSGGGGGGTISITEQ